MLVNGNLRQPWAVLIGLTIVFVTTFFAATAAEYFPSTAFGDQGSSIVRTYATRQFSIMNEPILQTEKDRDYAIRIALFRPDLDASVLRIERTTNGSAISVFRRFQVTASGDINPTPIAVAAPRIESTDVASLITEIQRRDFFSIGETDLLVLGGPGRGIWLVEVRSQDKHHAVYRSSSEPGDPIRDIADIAARISRVTYPGN